jgi:uroporphyrin-3 C-methyltransferase
MNSDIPKEKEGVVIDVEPEQEAPATSSASGDEAQGQHPDGGPTSPAGNGAGGRGVAVLALLVGGVALALTLGAGWFAYQQWQQLNDELAAARNQGGSAAVETQALGKRIDDMASGQQTLDGRVVELQTRVGELGSTLAQVGEQFTEQQQLLSSERTQLDERETQLRSLVADLHDRVGRSGNQWLLAEAEYLLKLADYRLRLASDPATARTALALADERLRATGDPGWAGVREQIARDLTALDTLSLPDVTGMWSRLGALIGQVPRLELADDPRTLTRATAPADTAMPPVEERTWRTLLSDLWSGIKNAVRIRRNDEPVAAMLPPEQEYFLYENLRLRLEQARVALVQGRAEIYRQSLDEALGWLGQHFAAGPVADGMAAALQELLSSPVQTELPDLSDSLRALQARRDVLKALPAPVPAPEPGTEQPAAAEAASA